MDTDYIDNDDNLLHSGVLTSYLVAGSQVVANDNSADLLSLSIWDFVKGRTELPDDEFEA